MPRTKQSLWYVSGSEKRDGDDQIVVNLFPFATDQGDAIAKAKKWLTDEGRTVSWPNLWFAVELQTIGHTELEYSATCIRNGRILIFVPDEEPAESPT